MHGEFVVYMTNIVRFGEESSIATVTHQTDLDAWRFRATWILVCPLSNGRLGYDEAQHELISRSAKLAYPIRDGILILLSEEARRIERSRASAMIRTLVRPALSGASAVYPRENVHIATARANTRSSDARKNGAPGSLIGAAPMKYAKVNVNRNGPTS